jgi:hypothetical protein
MTQNLYTQLRFVEDQCRVWNFTKRETDELLKLCPYGFVDRFPVRARAIRGRRGRVITAANR